MATMAVGVGYLAVLMLGLCAGAVLAEACVLVPMWRAQAPESFLRWYREHAALLLRFFGTLEIVALVVTTLAALLGAIAGVPGWPWLAGASLLMVVVLATFPLYFQKVNASFAAATIAPNQVPAELRRWNAWHWARTAIATASFALALLALG